MKSLVDAIIQRRRLTPNQLAILIDAAGQSDFTPDLLEADEPLWGSFWGFDVISPGYTLPAIELNLLRATRLDRHWPENTAPNDFLADLHTVIQQPRAGVWTTILAQQPLAIFAALSPSPHLMTVVWYGVITTHLHAGYRVEPCAAYFDGLRPQRQPDFHLGAISPSPSGWLREYSLPNSTLDAEILRWRAK